VKLSKVCGGQTDSTDSPAFDNQVFG
jgi:hypothetical protein